MKRLFIFPVVKNLVVIVAVAGGFWLVSALPVRAEAGIQLSPPVYDIVLKNNPAVERQFEVKNIGEWPIEITVTLKTPLNISSSLSAVDRITLLTPTHYQLKPEEKMVNKFTYDVEPFTDSAAYFALFDIVARSTEETFGFNELEQQVALSLKISIRNQETVVPNYIPQTELKPVTWMIVPETRKLSLQWVNATPDRITGTARLSVTNKLSSSETYTVESASKELSSTNALAISQDISVSGFWPRWYAITGEFLPVSGTITRFSSTLVYISWQSIGVLLAVMLISLRVFSIFLMRKRKTEASS